jgi:Tfp pilus assembly protein PilF
MHERQGNSQGAIEQYEKALKAEQKNLDALVGLARLHDRERRFDRANELYRRAVAAHPNNATVRNDLGLCLKRQGQIEAAVESLERAVQLEPKKTIYRNNLARVLVEQGRDDDALVQLSAVHEAPIAHYNLGYMINEADRSEQAAIHLQKAIELRPGFAQAEQLLARLDGEANAVASTPAGEPARARISGQAQASPYQTVAVTTPRPAPATVPPQDRLHGPASWSLSDDTIVKRTPKIDGEENSLALEMPQAHRSAGSTYGEPAPTPEQYEYQFGYGRVSHLPPVESETR